MDTIFAIFFQSFPYFCNPSRNSLCSLSSQRPVLLSLFMRPRTYVLFCDYSVLLVLSVSTLANTCTWNTGTSFTSFVCLSNNDGNPFLPFRFHRWSHYTCLMTLKVFGSFNKMRPALWGNAKDVLPYSFYLIYYYLCVFGIEKGIPVAVRLNHDN